MNIRNDINHQERMVQLFLIMDNVRNLFPCYLSVIICRLGEGRGGERMFEDFGFVRLKFS